MLHVTLPSKIAFLFNRCFLRKQIRKNLFCFTFTCAVVKELVANNYRVKRLLFVNLKELPSLLSVARVWRFDLHHITKGSLKTKQ